MTYDTEAIIPVEIGLLTSRTDRFEDDGNDHLLCRHLDLVEENREIISVKLANY